MAAIRHDQTISEPLRQAAIAWADRYDESLTRDQAQKLVGFLFGQLLPRSAVLEAFRDLRPLIKSCGSVVQTSWWELE